MVAFRTRRVKVLPVVRLVRDSKSIGSQTRRLMKWTRGFRRKVVRTTMSDKRLIGPQCRRNGPLLPVARTTSR